MNRAMRMEREQFLGAAHYDRAPERRGYADGAKPKMIDTPAGTLCLDVPQTAGTDNFVICKRWRVEGARAVP